ncbi:MAG TPA: ATP-binding protein [Tahibacter sp.]|nr:ATP-binding protein [Tahibacter sp.]
MRGDARAAGTLLGWRPSRLTIRQQLLSLFGLMLATGATVLVLDTLSQQETVDTMRSVRDDSLAGLRYVKGISDAYGFDVVDTTFRVRNHLMGWDQGVEVVDRAMQRVLDQWDALSRTRLTPEQASLVADIARRRESADRAAAKLRAILVGRDLPALGRFADTELYPAIDPVTTRLAFLSDLKMVSANENLAADVARAWRVNWWRVGLSVVTLLVVLLVGRQILRHIYRGVEKLVRLANATQQGDYDAPVGRLPRGELGVVAEAFLNMRDALAHKEVELRESEAHAQDANRAKSAFLAAMSHEIRTPMIGVTGMLELLSHTELDAEQRHCVTVIETSAQALLQIIGDILDFSKIEAGRLDLAPEPTDLRRLVETTVNNFLGVASSRGLNLSLTVDPNVAPAHRVDPLRARQILSNLVSNALKFTHKGGVAIELELLMQDDESQTLALRVQDTGIGIDQAHQDRLFAPFAQADAGTARAYGGTGLGLAICLRLARLLGGDLGLRSQLGEGTTVTLVLQLPKVSADTIARHRDGGAAEFALRAAPTVADAERERSLILVVDDHPTNREVVARQLERAGYASIGAADGADALELWKTQRFALMLADVHMPRMDGYALAAAVRAHEQREGLPRTPIVALTANVTKGEAERCVAAGMDDFLGKPVGIAQLARKMRQWLPHVAFPAPIASAVATTPMRPVAVPADDAAPIDLAALSDIAGGDNAVVASLVRDFVESTARDVAAIAQAHADGDADALARNAHRIKGASRLVGATALADAADALERRTRGGEPKVSAEVDALTAAFEVLNAWSARTG